MDFPGNSPIKSVSQTFRVCLYLPALFPARSPPMPFKLWQSGSLPPARSDSSWPFGGRLCGLFNRPALAFLRRLPICCCWRLFFFLFLFCPPPTQWTLKLTPELTFWALWLMHLKSWKCFTKPLQEIQTTNTNITIELWSDSSDLIGSVLISCNLLPAELSEHAPTNNYN